MSMFTSSIPIIFIIVSLNCSCAESTRYHSFLVPNDVKSNSVLKQAKIVEATSDKAWQTSNSFFHSLEKVETAALHAAVDAVRNEVDTIFHEIDHNVNDSPSTTRSKATSKRNDILSTKAQTVSVKPEVKNTLTRYPYDLSYGWGLD